MISRHTLGAVLGLVLVGAAGVASCNKSSGVGVDAACSINSDCASQLVCAFGRCHDQCKASRDCPSGERCVVSGSLGVCQLTQESLCAAGTPCETGEVCGPDLQCRLDCTASGGCVAGDYCVTTAASGACYSASTSADEPTLISEGILSADGAVIGDASTVALTPDGSAVASGTDAASASDGASGTDGTQEATGSSGSDGGDATVAPNPCINPQTTFRFTGQGDTNPHFTSAVGARSTNALFLFSGYTGPDPNGDAGGTNFGTMFVQAFDPSTGASLGPSTPIFPASTFAAGSFLYSAAVAPTGQIVVLSACAVGAYGCQGMLSAAFFTPSSDAGVGLGGGVGLQVEREVVVASSYQSDGNEAQPQVFWSNASDSFVVNYGVNSNGLQITLSEYTADGAAAGGASFVPTDSSAGTQNIRTSAGVSGNLVGVPFLSTLAATKNYPGLSVLNLQGTQVGSSIYLANTIVEGPLSIAAAGTPQGFVAAFSEQSSTLVTFVPASSSGIVADGGALPTMTLRGGATGGGGLMAIGDDVGTGGAKGVGVALDYDSGLSFAYVSADGSQVSGPVSVLPYVGSNQFSMTNYNGSTVLTISGSNNNSAQIAASGCQ